MSQYTTGSSVAVSDEPTVHHDSHSALAHQFDDLQQQHQSDELGMWLFLSTEIMFFGGVFLAYTIYRLQHEAAFAAASHELDLLLGTVNTGVLLCSSLTMALAVQAAQVSKRQRLFWLLVATIVLGSVFLGIKAIEYIHKYEHGLMPLGNLPFHWDKPEPGPAEMFFDLYFVMTGIHALHMVIGIAILAILAVAAYRGKLLGDFHAPVHITGLYWHFVDIVWVFLFPLLYLIGAHS
jgi:cytochrome c oxidase subunit III